MSIIDDLATAAKDAAATIEPAVVSIGRAGRGTGFVVAPGKVLTNAHNLRDRTTTISFADGRTVQGSVAGIDPDGDLAVLDVDTGDASALPWAASPPVQADVVFAGARGGHRFRVSLGLVSATDTAFRGPRGRRIRGSVEHTAPLARGSSGGPVVNPAGEVVAVSTNRVGDGFYLALPVDESLIDRVARLVAGESAERPRLGIAIASRTAARHLRASVGLSERDGLLVDGVAPGSPADRAGISKGDLLVKAADTELGSVDDLHDALDGVSQSGDGPVTLTLVVVRGEDERTVDVSFAATADDAEPDADGGA